MHSAPSFMRAGRTPRSVSASLISRHPFGHTATHRPVGEWLIWILYNACDGVWLAQLFNYITAAVAWIIPVVYGRYGKSFSVAAMVAGGVYFTGYIFLFHLHGVFYAPLLVFVSAALVLAEEDEYGKLLKFSIIGGTFTGLIHSFAFAVMAAIALGVLVELWNKHKKSEIPLAVFLLMLSLVMMKIFVLKGGQTSLIRHLSGFLKSYELTEISHLIVPLTFLFTVVTILSMRYGKVIKALSLMIAGVIFVFVLMKVVKFPYLFVLTFFALLKMISLRKFVVSAMLIAAFLLPIATGVGTPAYAIYTVFIAIYISAYDTESLLNYEFLKKFFRNKVWRYAVVVAVVLFVLLIRMGVEVPVMFKFALPILAEREKTLQGEAIVDFVLNSPYRRCVLVPAKKLLFPNEADDVMDRRTRPPFDAKSINRFLDYIRGEPSVTDTLVASFGNSRDDTVGMILIFYVKGKYINNARLYRK